MHIKKVTPLMHLIKQLVCNLISNLVFILSNLISNISIKFSRFSHHLNFDSSEIQPIRLNKSRHFIISKARWIWLLASTDEPKHQTIINMNKKHNDQNKQKASSLTTLVTLKSIFSISTESSKKKGGGNESRKKERRTKAGKNEEKWNL